MSKCTTLLDLEESFWDSRKSTMTYVAIEYSVINNEGKTIKNYGEDTQCMAMAIPELEAMASKAAAWLNEATTRWNRLIDENGVW